VVAHDSIYRQTARDPEIFYECGKKGWIVVTSDREFMKSFPHMAAVDLGGTKVIAFSQNNYNSEVRGRAFIKALARINKAIVASKKKSFIGIVGMDASFRVVEDSPKPNRKQCDQKDWDSYEQVCKAEGRLFLVVKQSVVA
jgi:predicted nuclease of predicted toxin-antitoxin system